MQKKSRFLVSTLSERVGGEVMGLSPMPNVDRDAPFTADNLCVKRYSDVDQKTKNFAINIELHNSNFSGASTKLLKRAFPPELGFIHDVYSVEHQAPEPSMSDKRMAMGGSLVAGMSLSQGGGKSSYSEHNRVTFPPIPTNVEKIKNPFSLTAVKNWFHDGAFATGLDEDKLAIVVADKKLLNQFISSRLELSLQGLHDVSTSHKLAHRAFMAEVGSTVDEFEKDLVSDPDVAKEYQYMRVASSGNAHKSLQSSFNAPTFGRDGAVPADRALQTANSMAGRTMSEIQLDRQLNRQVETSSSAPAPR